MVGELGISPSEYWSMTPSEINTILESKRPKEVGGLHEDDFYMLMEKRQELINDGIKVL